MNFSPDLFSYTVRDVDDAYEWGAHAVPRVGVVLALTFLTTGQKKEFYMAGTRPHDGLHAHMKSMTDDLLTSFFVKGGKPKKEKKDV
jgi:hypothetical protein